MTPDDLVLILIPAAAVVLAAVAYLAGFGEGYRDGLRVGRAGRRRVWRLRP